MLSVIVLVLGLYNSSHAVRLPALLVMPLRLSASSSLIHSDGNVGRVAAVLFICPGVNTELLLADPGAGLNVASIPEPESRTVSGPLLVLGRYQKLSV